MKDFQGDQGAGGWTKRPITKSMTNAEGTRKAHHGMDQYRLVCTPVYPHMLLIMHMFADPFTKYLLSTTVLGDGLGIQPCVSLPSWSLKFSSLQVTCQPTNWNEGRDSAKKDKILKLGSAGFG